MFADDYIDLKIDVQDMKNGKEVGQQLRGDRPEGLPWFTIIDSDGKELISSDGPDGNIGCPVTKEECAHFVSMIKQTIQHAPEGRVEEIANALETFAQKNR